MGASGVPSPPPTIFWLRDFFDSQGLVNPFGFWQHLQAQARAIIPEAEENSHRQVLLRIERKRLLAVSYERVRVYFWMLSQLGAIVFDHEEPSERGPLPKRFYRKLDDAWFIPGLQQHFYPATALGASRYRSRVERQEAVPTPAAPPGRQNPAQRGSRYWEEPQRPPEALPARAHRRPRSERGT